MSQKKIFKVILLINLFFFSIITLANSKNWSNIQDGPRSVEEAKKNFKGRKIDNIEGIWFQSGLGIVTIFKSVNVYKMYIIEMDGDDKQFERTWESTFIKRGSSDYDFFSRIWYSQSDGSFNYRTQSGKVSLDYKSNKFNQLYDTLSTAGKDMNSTNTRIWPTDFETYNLQFKKKVKIEPEKKTNFTPLVVQPKKDQNYWWVLIVIVLLSIFLYFTTVRKKNNIKIVKKKSMKKTPSLISNIWNGKITYAQSFWIYYFVIGSILSLPLVMMTDNQINNFLILYLLFLLFFITYIILVTVGTWRSAEVYKRNMLKKKKSLLWGYLGQVYIALAVIRSLSQVIKEFI